MSPYLFDQKDTKSERENRLNEYRTGVNNSIKSLVRSHVSHIRSQHPEMSDRLIKDLLEKLS